jgi:hypothetical protein
MYAYLTGDGRDYNGNGKFELSVRAIIPAGNEADAFAAQLDKLGEEGLARVNGQLAEKKKPQKKALNFELYSRDDESGDLIVKFKAPAKVKSSKTGEVYPNRVRFFDAAGNIAENLNIGNGTQAKVIFQTYAWLSPIGCGVRLEPKAVQVLDYVPYAGSTGKTAADFGIEAEDGYAFDAAEESDAEGEPTDGAASVGAGEV